MDAIKKLFHETPGFRLLLPLMFLRRSNGETLNIREA